MESNSTKEQLLKENELLKSRIAELERSATEQKTIEEALHKSEEIFSDFIKSASEGIIIYDSDLNLIEINKTALEVFPTGTKKQDLKGKHLLEIDPSSKESGRHEKYLNVIKTGESLFRKEMILDTKFENLHFEVNAFKVGAGLGVIFTDITERILTEAKIKIEKDKLNTIFESIHDGVYIVNKEHDIQYINSVLIKDLGQPEGKKCYTYFHDLEEPCLFCKNEEVLAGKTVHWEWTSPKNGKTYDLIDSPMRNSDGSIFKLEIFRDITDRKQMEISLKESEEKFSKSFYEHSTPMQILDINTI